MYINFSDAAKFADVAGNLIFGLGYSVVLLFGAT